MTTSLALYLPFVVTLALAVVPVRLLRVLPPGAAVPILAVGAFVTALAAGLSLAVLAVTGIAQIAALANLGGWSAAALRSSDPLPIGLALALAVLVIGLLAAAIRRLLVACRDLLAAERICRRLPTDAGNLVIVEDPAAHAYALAGLRGRIVVSTGLLRVLKVGERRAMLAHESSHLDHHHHLYVALADLAAAANPLLRRVAKQTRVGIERWADEDAALAVGDRVAAARALARASFVASGGSEAGDCGSLATTRGSVDRAFSLRAGALLQPAPRRRRLVAGALTATILCTAIAGFATAGAAEDTFEAARIAAAGH